MKRSAGCILAVFVLVVFGCDFNSSHSKSTSSSSNSPAADDHVAGEDFEHVLAQAKSEGKLVFLEFSAKWCGPCQRMKNDTFSNAKVRAKLSNYVTHFVDADRDTSQLMQRYGVRAIPAYFVLRPDGKAIASGENYKNPNAFLNWLDSAR